MGHLLELKYEHSSVRIAYFTVASTSVPFRPAMVQMQNLELIENKRITVQYDFTIRHSIDNQNWLRDVNPW
jgi:type IV secretory pathway component VirB8